ncbi:snoRNA-binding rRNA-processing protein imp4 [Kappamyces sp. JEL0829]|nr:snoRNA-binding rRNA-processing protein imp4 [Kappamyces sp. JEL0829]
MDRKRVRERREYLYRKSLEQKEKLVWDKKQELKNSLADGKQLTGKLRKESAGLQKDLLYDENQASPSTHIDDEYARAGEVDPKILITTSRDPSSRLTQFAKEMKLMFPNSQRMNRGNYVIGDIVDACRQNGATDLIIFHEHRGQPDGMVVSHFPHGPTAYFTLHNVVFRHDIPDSGTVSEQFPHLIFDKFGSKLGERVMNILKYLFPVPKEDATRVMTFANNSDFISFRHHVFQKIESQVSLVEVGPRFEMQVYQIKLGTMDITEADVEWVYRPYMNTAKKRMIL